MALKRSFFRTASVPLAQAHEASEMLAVRKSFEG
jgi:hypothetical protein